MEIKGIILEFIMVIPKKLGEQVEKTIFLRGKIV